MAKRVTGPSTGQLTQGTVSANEAPGGASACGWRLTATAAGVGHAGVMATNGMWPALLLAAATVSVAGAWSWLLAGHRQDLSGMLGVVWLATAMVVTDVPLAVLTAVGAGVAALAAACGSLR